MSDLIDRQALLKQIDIDSDGEPGYYGDTWKFIDTIKNMPNVHDLPKDADTISRQAAIDAFNTNLNELVIGGEENAKTVENYLNRVLDKIKYLPSALSTNLAEVGTDCISRQAAIDALSELATFTDECSEHTWMYTDDVYKAIKQLPPAQPERIKGHWIHVGGTRYRCNKCGEIARKRNFCPNCGANMREVAT